MTYFLWHGKRVLAEQFSAELENIERAVCAALAVPFSVESVVEAAHALACQMRSSSPLEQNKTLSALHDALQRCWPFSANEASQLFEALAQVLEKSACQKKLLREFGTTNPHLPSRVGYADHQFEAWAPLGVLTHVCSGNSPGLGALSVFEGLLSGNVNVFKFPSEDGAFSLEILAQLAQLDSSGQIAARLFGGVLESRDPRFQALLNVADGVVVWGGDEAVAGVRARAPRNARIVAWGHKLSFIYVSQATMSSSSINNDPEKKQLFKNLAFEICNLDQQSCSSPQCIFVETNNMQELEAFAAGLANELLYFSPTIPQAELQSAEAAEITMLTLSRKCQETLGCGKVLEGKNWRIFLAPEGNLLPSPLFRTIWLKPLLRSALLQTLRPMRSYLQTVGLACSADEVGELVTSLTSCGALRVRRIGEMTNSYAGEPHDGSYALVRYSKRISVQLPQWAQGISDFSQLKEQSEPVWKNKPPAVLSKVEFQNSLATSPEAHLFFKSGGSSGEPKTSPFTYSDYQQQMRAAADGLYASGLNPQTDRCMNLFFGGGLYGGFLSFFTILENLQAVQLPMAAHTDLEFVAKNIVRYKVDTLLGMPSYIMRLFNEQSKTLAEYGGIKKIFFGGEHFPQVARTRLAQEFGIDFIRSGAYGSVDAGPLGYQCEHTSGSVHHVLSATQFLEIVKIDSDQPVSFEGEFSEIGRLIFTSKCRTAVAINRYDIGDLGRWLKGVCACGRRAPRFELMGRSGDVFRCGGNFFNYQKFCTLLSEFENSPSEIQIIVARNETGQDILELQGDFSNLICSEVEAYLIQNYFELRESVVQDKALVFRCVVVTATALLRTPGSGKLVRIVDRRV